MVSDDYLQRLERTLVELREGYSEARKERDRLKAMVVMLVEQRVLLLQQLEFTRSSRKHRLWPWRDWLAEKFPQDETLKGETPR